MLTGIKIGKRKRKNDQKNSNVINKKQPESDPPTRNLEIKGLDDRNRSIKSSTTTKDPSLSANLAAAKELRELLTMGGDGRKTISSSPMKPYNDVESSLNEMERRGRISMPDKISDEIGNDNVKVLLLSERMEKEEFRSKHKKDNLNDDKSITEMIAEERRSQQTGKLSTDEICSRNIARLGSNYKGKGGLYAGVDEDYGGYGGTDMKLFTDSSERLSKAEKYAREKSRRIAQADKELAITNRCWWWLESGSFRKHMLLSLGDHVSLVLNPYHLSIVNFQCILVPIKYTEAFVASEDEVWDEVQRFQTSIRAMFREKNMGVLFCETVLPSKSIWQARMDIIPVPKSVEQDAATYFKSALTEQAEEWGTHTKLLSTKNKGLRRTIPKGFHYFYVEWEGGGFAQMIETDSFPKDFALDVVAGMMELDPVRFKRKQKKPDQDKNDALNFLRCWKKNDWTLALDDTAKTLR